MPSFDDIVFKEKKFSDILEDIYSSSKEKTTTIDSLIEELRPLVKTARDATLIVPLIKEYLDVGVKNDEQVVKLAAIVQRVISSENKTSLDDSIFDEADLEDLRQTAEDEQERMQKVNEKAEKKLNKLTENIDDLLDETGD